MFRSLNPIFRWVPTPAPLSSQDAAWNAVAVPSPAEKAGKKMKAIEVPVAAYLGVQLGLEILDCCRLFNVP